MIKEILLAITLGALLGFGITGGFLAIKKEKIPTANTTYVVSPTPTITSTSTASPTTTPNEPSTDHKITIESPVNESITTSSQVTIKGTTTANSSLLVISPTKTYYSTADNSGNFNINIEVDSGVNLLQVDAIDQQDNQASAQLLITYSTAKI